LLIRSVHRRTGSDRWSLLKSSPVLDDDGVAQATITIIEDVTEQQRAERHNAFLARASEVLASSLDYERTLRNVAQLAVPEIVDWCAVDILDEDGQRQSLAVAHTDPARVRLARELREYEPAELDPEQGLGRVFRTGQPLLYPEIPDELLVSSARDERHLELLRSVGMRSAAVVPMRLGTRTLGAMSLVSAESGRVLDRTDLDLAEQIAARAAVAIENARLYTQRSRIAHTLQASLLPQTLPQIPGYELASAYIPAVAGTEVGGDFYDVWPVGSGWMITVGDVTGKGVQAAALTSLVRHTLRAASGFLATPAALLAHLDHILKTQPEVSLCTALCLHLDAESGRLTMATGGHPPPLYVSASAEDVGTVGRYGPLLGGLSDVHWEDVAVELEPGAQLLLYTDGITDAVGESGERYGLGRLTDQLRAGRPRTVSNVVDAITRSVAEFQTGPHADDMALLALGRLSGETRPAGRSQAGETEPATIQR
jgi:serine phosphatase RsbU (regulator of sigma subunit)